jgi:drug/metabolite transporter (DMT)-like permease
MALDVPTPESAPPFADASQHAHGLYAIALILVSVAFATVGQFTLKAAMNQAVSKVQASGAVHTLSRAAREPLLWGGLALFGVSALFWLIVLSKVDLSFAYPFVGLSYIIIVLVARLILHEHVPSMRWVGVAIVAIGIAIVGISFRRVGG